MVTAGSFRAGGLFIFAKEMINIAIKLATSITYTADGSQTNFSIPFDYLRPSFVHVAVNDVEVSEGFTVSNRMVMFDSAPAKDTTVHIYRSTPTTRLVSWADASILKAIDMTIAEVQQLHILEESSDWSKTNSIVLDEESGAWQGRKCRMSNIADPVDAQDVVTKHYLENTEDSFVQRMNAIKTQTEQFMNTAGNHKDSAYKSAQSASASAASAAESARLAEGYKTAAETAKSNASLYAANAKTSTDNADASKEAAQSAATTASNFASDARNSAGEAKTYRDNAKTYMDNAKNYSENVNVFLPSVSSDGVLSWTNKAGLTNPASVNIKGAKGDQGLQGVQGVQGVKGEKGDKGDTGARGATGAAASIRIGSVTTGAAGSSASVTNSGTASNVVLDFTLPRGKDGKDGGVTVDDTLSDTSTNPIQNKAVNAGINTVKSNMTKGFQTITASIPTKVSDLENDVGYLNMGTLPVFASTDNANHWTARQTFNEAILKEAVLTKARLLKEVYQSDCVTTDGTGSSPMKILPTRSTMHFTIATKAGTVVAGIYSLDMATIVAECLGNNQTSTIFTAYITSDADYTLTITNAGTIKYVGSASDVAITSAGLLLNILMLKDSSGNVTSIVQASKLEGGA